MRGLVTRPALEGELLVNKAPKWPLVLVFALSYPVGSLASFILHGRLAGLGELIVTFIVFLLFYVFYVLGFVHGESGGASSGP